MACFWWFALPCAWRQTRVVLVREASLGWHVVGLQALHLMLAGWSRSLCRGTCSVQSSKRSMLSIANQMASLSWRNPADKIHQSPLSSEEQLALHAFQGQRSSGSRLPMYTFERKLTRFLSRTLEWTARGRPIEKGVWTVCWNRSFFFGWWFTWRSLRVFWTRNWQATSTVLTSSSLRIPEIVITIDGRRGYGWWRTGVVGILEVFKASVEWPVPVLHDLFSQYVGHVLQLSNYFTVIQQCRPNFHSLANCFGEDNVVRFVFAKRFDDLGIWKIFSIELFQMLAVVCRLVKLYVIYLQN